MKKLLALAASLALALPIAASAATIPATAIFGGQTGVWGNPGQTVTATPHVFAAGGEVVHAIRTDFIGDNRESVCHDIANFTGAQDIDVSVSDVLPPNTGDYGYTIQVYTAANMQQADAMTGSAACTGSNTMAYNQGNVVHVLPTGTGSSSGGSTSSSSYQAQIDALMELVKSLQSTLALLTANGSVGTGGTKPACPPSAYVVGTSALQSWLVDHSYMTQAQVNTGPGIYGPQTKAAEARALNACK